jgi:hypothetical protein
MRCDFMTHATVVGFSWAKIYGKVEAGKRSYALLSAVSASSNYDRLYIGIKCSCQQLNGIDFFIKMKKSMS